MKSAQTTGGIERVLKKAAAPSGDRGAALDRLRGMTDYEAPRSCDVIIEAATENGALKVAILQRIDAVAPDQQLP